MNYSETYENGSHVRDFPYAFFWRETSLLKSAHLPHPAPLGSQNDGQVPGPSLVSGSLPDPNTPQLQAVALNKPLKTMSKSPCHPVQEPLPAGTPSAAVHLPNDDAGLLPRLPPPWPSPPATHILHRATVSTSARLHKEELSLPQCRSRDLLSCSLGSGWVLGLLGRIRSKWASDWV